MKKQCLFLLLIVICALLFTAASARAQAEWTVLWYLCGTDLETEGGAATYNLIEAAEGKSTDDVNVIIVTGGTVEWQNDIIPNDAVGIYRLRTDGGLDELKMLADDNMGSEALLTSVIRQVYADYPAKRSMLIVWDHGGGSVGGVAFDERTDDSLSLDELQTALDGGGQYFDIIGFDACLMSSLEIANVLSPYADYMIASQELEPSGGWHYRALMEEFSRSPAIAPEKLGVRICDSYLEHCIAWEDSQIATLAFVDLQKVPALVEAFDAMAWQLTSIAETPAAIQAFRQEAGKARNFGGNNRAEGYTHMVDLGELVLNTEGVWDTVGLAVLDRLFEAVLYTIDGSDAKKTNGLSVFYPYTSDSEVSYACAAIAEAPVSKAYMRFVAALVPSWSASDDLNQALGERPEGSYQEGETIADAGSAEETSVAQLSAAEAAVEFSAEIDEFGYYTLYIESGIDYVEEVQFALYLIDEEEDEAILLGTDNDIDAYWDEGVFYDNFRGVWLTLNGQYCSPILIDSQDEYNLYTIPILLNAERTNLRVKFVIETWDDDGITGSYQAVGVWDGIDGETGLSARDIKPLKEGDVIIPLFDAYPLYDENNGTSEWTGGEVVAGAGGAITLSEDDLFDGEYYYTFILTDIYGQVYESDGVSLIMEGEDFYFASID